MFPGISYSPPKVPYTTPQRLPQGEVRNSLSLQQLPFEQALDGHADDPAAWPEQQQIVAVHAARLSVLLKLA